MSDADEAQTLRRVNALIETIPTAQEPYWVAVDVSSVASEALVTSLIACDLWRMWSALEDRYELKPEERPEATQEMRRAATEWLAVKDNVAARDAYLDRWLYEILGYKRDMPKGWSRAVRRVRALAPRALPSRLNRRQP